MRTTIVPILIAGVALVVTGCGKSGDVTIQSAAFNTGATARTSLDAYANVAALTATVTDFKICIEKVKLENEDDKIEQKDGKDDVEFKPGLIDLTSGAAKSWGDASIPVGFKLKRIKIKVHKDKELCGVDYSVKFNSATTPEDIEFKWRFEPPVDINVGDKVTVALDSVVSELRLAIDQGDIASLKERIEKIEGSASKED